MSRRRSINAKLSFAVSLAGLAVSACSQPASSNQQNSADSGQPASAPPIAALPLATAAPVAMQSAPPVGALPPVARPLRYTGAPRADRYRYTERAYAMSNAFGDTPPDYTVEYQGTRPWIWRSNSGGYRFVEQVPGGQRDYYYQPGDTQPFYVSDPDGGYAYDRGELVGIYGSDGVPVDDIRAAERADAAGRYLYRARQLYHAAQYQQRQAAYAADWQARRDAVIAQRQSWEAARARDADWQAWHDAHERDERKAWQDEQNRRTAYAAAIGIGVGVADVALTRHHDGGAPNGVSPADRPGAFYGPQNAGYGQPPRGPQPQQPPTPRQVQPFHPANPQPQPQPVRPQAPPAQVIDVRQRTGQEAQRQAQLAHQQQIAAARSANIAAQVNAAKSRDADNALLQQTQLSRQQAEFTRQQRQVASEHAAALNAAASARMARDQAIAVRNSERQANAQHQQKQIQQQQQQRPQQQRNQQQASRIAEQAASWARQQADTKRQIVAPASARTATMQHEQQNVVRTAIKHDAAHQPGNPRPQKSQDDRQNPHPSQ